MQFDLSFSTGALAQRASQVPLSYLLNTTTLSGAGWTATGATFDDATKIIEAPSTTAGAFIRYSTGAITEDVQARAIFEVADENTGWAYFHIRTQSVENERAYIDLSDGSFGTITGAGTWNAVDLGDGFYRVTCDYDTGSGTPASSFVQVQIAQADGDLSVSSGDAIKCRRVALRLL
ncbi:phage head spike fiber domain-containing protein [Vannielia litorea]|uniref:phage head spike fiber domain-containing protein n=1 Tax=Vannielia litorea TaxID=1217970 RepID=UPI001BCD5668|nr:hypothetical protein [Vannielia litorea]MBS8228347.1 hypothetical protein [Vannielia litorea]